MKLNPISSYSSFRNLSSELRFLLACLSYTNGRMGSLPHDVLSDMDWQSFLKLSEQHCLGPLIFRAIRQGSMSSFPEKVRKTLADGYKNNIFISMSLSDALRHLAERFQTAGLRMISLKGPALAQALFNDISLRLSSDLDILVPADDLDRIEALLKNMGYRSAGRNRRLTKRQKKLFLTVHHHRTFVHPQTRVNLEVHWRLSRLQGRFLAEYPFDSLWERSDRVLLNDMPITVLGPIDNLLYLCIHGAFHQWSRLSWLFDVHEILKKWPEAKIDELLCRHQNSAVGDVLGQTLFLLDVLFGTDYIAQRQNGLDLERAVKLALMVPPFLETSETAKEATLFSGHMYRIIVYMFALLRKSVDKMQYIKGLLMPTDLEIQTLSIPDILFPLYFLLHPVCTVYRSMAKMIGLKDPFVPSHESS